MVVYVIYRIVVSVASQKLFSNKQKFLTKKFNFPHPIADAIFAVYQIVFYVYLSFYKVLASHAPVVTTAWCREQYQKPSGTFSPGAPHGECIAIPHRYNKIALCHWLLEPCVKVGTWLRACIEPSPCYIKIQMAYWNRSAPVLPPPKNPVLSICCDKQFPSHLFRTLPCTGFHVRGYFVIVPDRLEEFGILQHQHKAGRFRARGDNNRGSNVFTGR